MNKLYLGDGVYVKRENGGIILTTENGYEVTNEIFLEPEVALLLANYLKRHLQMPQEDLKDE